MNRLKAMAFAIAVLTSSMTTAPLVAGQGSTSVPQEVMIPLEHLPLDLKGYLRRPDGDGLFPAVILLPACGAFLNSVDQGGGSTVASWGYVVLTLDVFTARGVKGGKTCVYPAPPETIQDLYRGLSLLVTQKSVDRSRIFVVGFGRAGSVALSAVDRDIQSKAKHRFRGGRCVLSYVAMTNRSCALPLWSSSVRSTRTCSKPVAIWCRGTTTLESRDSMGRVFPSNLTLYPTLIPGSMCQRFDSRSMCVGSILSSINRRPSTRRRPCDISFVPLDHERLLHCRPTSSHIRHSNLIKACFRPQWVTRRRRCNAPHWSAGTQQPDKQASTQRGSYGPIGDMLVGHELKSN